MDGVWHLRGEESFVGGFVGAEGEEDLPHFLTSAFDGVSGEGLFRRVKY